jgi:hypothetical protein
MTGWLRRKRLDERAFLVRLGEVQAEVQVELQGSLETFVAG